MPASYTDTVTPTITVDTATGAVLGLDLRLVRTVQVTAPSGVTVSAGTVSDSTLSTTPAAVGREPWRVCRLLQQQQRRQRTAGHRAARRCWWCSPLVLLAFGIPRLVGRRGRRTGRGGPGPAPTAEPAEPQRLAARRAAPDQHRALAADGLIGPDRT